MDVFCFLLKQLGQSCEDDVSIHAPTKGITWSSGIFLMLLVGAIYYAANAGITGPLYAADEIGYLNNAAFLAGRYVDATSSYHAGYSFLIAPLFYLFSDPTLVWSGVLVVNALLWGGTVSVVLWTVTRLSPDLPFWMLAGIALVIGAFPPSVSITGHAFSQPAVGLFFALSVASLFWVNPKKPLSVVPHAAFAGFCYWVHPTGIVVAVASAVSLSFWAHSQRSYRVLLVSLFVSTCSVLGYKFLFEPWRIQSMTAAGGTAALHYPAMGEAFSGMLKPAVWKDMFGVLLGQFSYLVVATFGFAAIGTVVILREVIRKVAGKGQDHRLDAADVAKLLMVLAPLACVAISVLTAAIARPVRMDHWIYGRYISPLLIVLFAFALSQGRKPWLSVGVSVLAFAAGLWLMHVAQISGPVARANTAGFWPEELMLGTNVVAWLAWGAAGIAVAGLMPRMLAMLTIGTVFVFTTLSNYEWHKRSLELQAVPYELVEFVRENFRDGCVHFDRASLGANESLFSLRAERGGLYSFFLFNYTFERGPAFTGSALNHGCEGPVFTYAPDFGERNSGYSIVGADVQTGMKVFVKARPEGYRYPKPYNSQATNSIWISRASEQCLLSGGCFVKNAFNLAGLTQVGELSGEGIRNTGRSGFLVFGPYARVSSGTYEIRVSGKTGVVRDAELDVVAERSSLIMMKERIAPNLSGEIAAWQFAVPQDVVDMEIRVRVAAQDDVTVEGYSLTRTGGLEQ